MEIVNERYELQAIAGKGGQAVVYKALDRHTNTLVAVKKVDLTSHRQDDLIKEVQILKSLKHKNIVHFIEEYRTKTHMYIVLEYAGMGSLLSILKHQSKQQSSPRPSLDEGTSDNSSPSSAPSPLATQQSSLSQTLGLVPGEKRFNDKATANFLIQVLEGLNYLHGQGIIHRDIKAANVLLTDDSVIKLTDFGLATSISMKANGGEGESAVLENVTAKVEDEEEDGPHHKPNNVVGSVYWMAPENIKGEAVTLASDVWSLGCLAVELLTGSPPFYDRTPANALYCIAESKDIPLPANLSRGALDFISHCLKPTVSQRWTAAQLLSHQWLVSGGTWGATQSVADIIDNEFSFSIKGLDNGAMILDPMLSTKSAASPTSLDDIMSGIVHSPQLQGGGASTTSQQQTIQSPKTFDPENIAAFLEAKLFSNEHRERDQWLRNPAELQKCVSALSYVTAEESFRIVRALYYAADQLRNHENGLFFTALGNTDLWDHDLLVMASIESLAPIFIFSCCFQDPSPETVSQYAASNKRALQLVLRSDFAAACIDAIYCIVTGGTDFDANASIKTPNVDRSANPDSAVAPPAHNVTNAATDDSRSVMSDGMASSTAAAATRSVGGTVQQQVPPVTALPVRENGAGGGGGAAGPNSQTNGNGSPNTKGSLASAVVPSALEAFRALTPQRVAVIRRRFEIDNAAETIAALVEDMTSATFATKIDPPIGWETVERLFAIIWALTSSKPLLRNAVTDRWIIALLEGANHRCPSAVWMYARLAREHTDLVARSMTVSTFLNIVVDGQVSADLRTAVMECFPILQEHDERCAMVLEDRSATVPLLAMALNTTAINAADYATPVVAKLCERPAMAAACASYPRFIPVVVSKMQKAMTSKNTVEMRNAVRLAQLMFAHSENPTAFVTSQQLTGTLAIATQHYLKVFPKDVLRGVADLLNALGEHSCIA